MSSVAWWCSTHAFHWYRSHEKALQSPALHEAVTCNRHQYVLPELSSTMPHFPKHQEAEAAKALELLCAALSGPDPDIAMLLPQGVETSHACNAEMRGFCITDFREADAGECRSLDSPGRGCWHWPSPAPRTWPKRVAVSPDSWNSWYVAPSCKAAVQHPRLPLRNLRRGCSERSFKASVSTPVVQDLSTFIEKRQRKSNVKKQNSKFKANKSPLLTSNGTVRSACRICTASPHALARTALRFRPYTARLRKQAGEGKISMESQGERDIQARQHSLFAVTSKHKNGWVSGHLSVNPACTYCKKLL